MLLRKLLWTGLYAALAAAGLMVKRAKGEAPTNEKPGEPRRAPAGPQLGGRPKPKAKRKGPPSPWVVLGGAIVGGYFLAKVVDWRGHGHPRD